MEMSAMAAAAPRVPANESVKSSFQITSADGTQLEIPAGRYYINTKARPERLMRDSLSNRARRVHAWLEPMTMGWQHELAVGMVKGGKTLASREDISERTGIAVQHVSSALAELKAAGYGDCKENSSDKRQLEIYSWAIPRPVEAPDTNRAKFVSPSWIPTDEKYLTSFIKRRKLKTYETLDHLDETARSSYLEELIRTARELEEAELRIARMLDPNCANECINKEEITEITEEKEREEEPPSPSPTPPPPSISSKDSHEIRLATTVR